MYKCFASACRIDTLKAFAESQVSDEKMCFAAKEFSTEEGGGGHVPKSAPVPTPTTKKVSPSKLVLPRPEADLASTRS